MSWKLKIIGSVRLSAFAALQVPGLPPATLRYNVLFNLQELMDSDDWQDIGEIASCLALDFHKVLDQVWPNSICCDVLPKCFGTATTFDRSCASLSATNRQGCSKGCIISIDQGQLLLVLNELMNCVSAGHLQVS